MPVLSTPYDPATFDQAFTAVGGSGWAKAFQGALQHNILAVEAYSGANPTWATMLGLALARMVLSAAVFLVLLSILRMLCNLLAGSLAFGIPASFLVRLAGGILEVGISAVWISVAAGVLYPVLSSGALWKGGEILTSSALMPVFLGIYQVLWPALVAKIK